MHDWPVGFHMGLKLKDFWKLEEHHLGEPRYTHYADGTARKNRMQGNDYVESAMYTKGSPASSCHDVHGTAYNADLIKPAQQLCLTCHGPNSPNGPRGTTIEAHTQAPGGSRGQRLRRVPHAEDRADDCERQRAQPHVQVHHAGDVEHVQDSRIHASVCHTTQTNEWATGQLKNWAGVSPWRVQ